MTEEPVRRRQAAFVCAAAALAVVALEFVPFVAFLFPVPLFVLLFRGGKGPYLASVACAFALATAVSVAMAFAVPVGADVIARVGVSSILLHAAGPALFILPLAWLGAPSVGRYHRRLAIAALTAGCGGVGFFALTGATAELAAQVRSVTDAMLPALRELVPEGFERDSFTALFSPDVFFDHVWGAFLSGILPSLIALYGISFVLASRVSRTGKARFARFSADAVLFYPLVLGMCGIVGARLIGSRPIETVSWNLTLGAGLFFAAEGYGVLLAVFDRLRLAPALRGLLVFATFAGLASTGLIPYAAGSLAVLGVIDLFVPIRPRLSQRQ